MRGARGLTLRGRCLLAAGVSAGVCGLVLGQQSLLRIAVLLLALPLVSVALAARSRSRLVLARTTAPARIAVGATSRVRLDLRNPSRAATGVLLAQDEVPPGWPRAPRFVVDRLGAGGRSAVTYAVRPPVRGPHELGPLRVRVTDPLGLCEVPVRLGGRAPLLVLPATQPVPGAAAVLGQGGGGEAGGGASAASGETGMGTREYRPGDDLRRVHWRSTARYGELMVRQDEQPRQRRAVVLLDRRAARPPRSGVPDPAFEAAVSAAASLAVSLAGAGLAVHLAHTGPRGPWHTGAAGADALLEELARVAPLGRGSAGAAGSGGGADAADAADAARGGALELPGAAEGGADDAAAGVVLVAVLGRLAAGDVERLLTTTARRGSAAVGLAVLVEPAERGAAAALARGGWAVLDLASGEPLAAAWSRLSGAPAATGRGTGAGAPPAPAPSAAPAPARTSASSTSSSTAASTTTTTAPAPSAAGASRAAASVGGDPVEGAA